jgi:hypothetical protein
VSIEDDCFPQRAAPKTRMDACISMQSNTMHVAVARSRCSGMENPELSFMATMERHCGKHLPKGGLP